MTRTSVGIGATLVLIASAVHAQQPAPQPAPPSKMEIAQACAGDIERLCPGVPPGEGRIKACMKAQITQVSAPCFDTLLRAVAASKEP